MTIGQKLSEEKIRPVGFAIKSVGSEAVESEYDVTGEIIGFGKAQGLKGTNMGNLLDLKQPSGVTTGTAQGIMTRQTKIL